MRNKYDKSHINKVVIGLMYVLLIVMIGYVVYTQKALIPEHTTSFTHSQEFNDGWKVNYLSEEFEISLPAKFDFDVDKEVRLTNVIPKETGGYNSLLIWNEGLDFKCYIDSKLIFTYDEDKIHNIGIDRPYLYVWVDLPPESEGKTIELVFEARRKIDTGLLGEIYVGDRGSLLYRVIIPREPELVFSLVVLCLSIGCMMAGYTFRKTLGNNNALIYIGLASNLVALWVLSSTNIRQFMVHNVSGVRNLAFLVIPFFPVTFLLYMDVTQKGRYHKLYHLIETLSLLDFIGIFIIHIFGILGLSESYIFTEILCLSAIITGFVTLGLDIYKNRIQEYLWSSMGLLCFGVLAVIQIYFYSKESDYTYGGLFLLSGIVILLICSIINAVRSIEKIRLDKFMAEKKAKLVSIEAIETIARTVDAKDAYTSEHSERVAAYSVLLATELGFDEEFIDKIRDGALLHDIGKIGIPDAVLNKPGKLTDEEYEIIKTHTIIGSDIMKKMSSVENADAVARYHHERYDGKGYPDGLKGEKIPVGARVVGIADAYDAMNSKRVYRAKLSREEIREELIRGRGTQFDPDFLDAFLVLFESHKLDEVETKDLSDLAN